jgi:hypothetical protein
MLYCSCLLALLHATYTSADCACLRACGRSERLELLVEGIACSSSTDSSSNADGGSSSSCYRYTALLTAALTRAEALS